MFNIDLAIKFGSNEITIYRKGIGIVAKEPAFLAVTENGNSLKVKATGKRAEKMFHSKSKDVTVYQPIENSTVVDEKMATLLMSGILDNVITDKFLLSKLSALVAVPCALNEEQLNLLERVLRKSGVNKMKFVCNSVCARAMLELDPNSHNMVVDIGKFVTDISVLNDFNFEFGRMYFIGGQDMDKSITTFISDNHNLEVSDLTSEAVKNEVASLYERDLYKTEYIGIDNNNRFVKNQISANEVRVAIVNIYDQIFEKVKEVLMSLTKDIRAEINENGILFVGGASSIAGLYEYAKKKLDVPVVVPENPNDYVILGAGKLLSSDKEFITI